MRRSRITSTLDNKWWKQPSITCAFYSRKDFLPPSYHNHALLRFPCPVGIHTSSQFLLLSSGYVARRGRNRCGLAAFPGDASQCNSCFSSSPIILSKARCTLSASCSAGVGFLHCFPFDLGASQAGHSCALPSSASRRVSMRRKATATSLAASCLSCSLVARFDAVGGYPIASVVECG